MKKDHNPGDYRCGITILNYNSHDLTLELVNKILSYDSIHEICVVDNGSADDFFDEFSNSKIHYIKNHENLGYSAGNNVGLKYLINEKKCNFVVIANPDVIFDNNAIIEMYKKMIEYPELALISTKRYGYNGTLIHQYFNFPLFKDSIKNCFYVTRKNFGREKYNIQNDEVDNTKDILFVDAVPGAFFGIRSSFLLEIDFMYEGVFLYGEEIILGRQASELEYKSGLINSGHYFHNHIQNRFSNRKMFWYDRQSLIKYYTKFKLLRWYQKIILYFAVLIGTIEYNLAYFLNRFFVDNN